MQTECGKWGNSLAIRIPGHMARELGIEQGSVTELTIEQGRLVIAPATRGPGLKALLRSMRQAGAVPEEEIDTGEARGVEADAW